MLPCFPADQDLWALLGACQNQDITRFKSLKPLNLRLPPETCIKELMSRHAEIQQEECIVMQLMYDVWGGCVVAAQPKGNMLLFQFTILFLVVSSFIFDVLTKQATGCPKTVCLFSSTKFTSIASASQRCPNTLWHLSLCSAQVFSFSAGDFLRQYFSRLLLNCRGSEHKSDFSFTRQQLFLESKTSVGINTFKKMNA